MLALCRCPDYNGDTVSLQTTFDTTRQSALCPGNYDQTIVGVAASAPVSGYLTTGPGKLRAQVATTKYTKLDGESCRKEESTFAVIFDSMLMPLPPNTLQGISSTTKDAALHFTATVGNGQFCSSFRSCSVSSPANCTVEDPYTPATISIQLDYDCKSLPRIRDDVVLAFAAVCSAPAEDVAVCGNTCSGGNLVGSVSFGNLGVIDVSIRDTKATVGNKVRSTYTSRPLPTPLPTLLP
jgi:hypothetical protein